MRNIEHAVILAAGKGARLSNTFDNKPKGFLQFGEVPIIEESVIKLVQHGIKKIVIVVGHLHEYYEQLADKYPCIKTTRNLDFAKTGSMHSLGIAEQFIHNDFLLLESDLIYEHKALRVLQNSTYDNCILLSGKTNSGDEVYVSGTDDQISYISKSKNHAKSIVGELVGISKISLDLYHRMVNHFSKMSNATSRYDYENCISDLSETISIKYKCINNLTWTEIDDNRQLIRAAQEIYPLIQKREFKCIDPEKANHNLPIRPNLPTATGIVKNTKAIDNIRVN